MDDPKNDPKNGSKESLLDLPVEVDQEQLAQIDALIEQHATAEHRMTREEMVRLLLEKGVERVKQGESLLPYLETLGGKDKSTKKD